jgi:hypothetical protein
MTEWQQVLKEAGGVRAPMSGGMAKVPIVKGPALKPLTMRPMPPPAPKPLPVARPKATPPPIPKGPAKAPGAPAASRTRQLVNLIKANPGKAIAGATILGGGGAILAGGRAGSFLADLPFQGKYPESSPAGEDLSSPELSELAIGAGGGAALGGLGSLLYGKLKNKPDLQRDVVLALIGAAAGGGYQMMKAGAQEKEAVVITGTALATAATIAAILAATGAGMYQSHQQFNKNLGLAREQMRLQDEANRGMIDEAARSRKALTHGTVGALGGGAIGGTLSNLYGKKTGKESLRRDIMSALAGAGLGGAAGLYSAAKA